MDSNVKAEYEAQAKELRASLKKWESDWAGGHNGAKPGRQDIKQNPHIAQMYKDYNKARDILAGKILAPSKAEPESKPQKRKSQSIPAETPVKKTKYAETPSKPTHEAEMMNSPGISRKLFSPAPITSLGPTPQRDGKVLGLFDLLVEKELGTPSKSASGKSQSAIVAGIQATPTKRRGSMSDESAMKLGRTPMSSSKRQMLNTFMTPLKNRNQAGNVQSPSSVSKLQFDTPAFLKRHSLPAVTEASEADAPPPPLRLPRKPLVRGLSEIVASLRKVEEDKLDDDLEALRDLENEEMGLPTTATKPAMVIKSKILEKDTQDGALPLGGFDDEGMYDSPVEGETGRDGLPLPIMKKKGQKRTTKLVRMKPTWNKRPSESGSNGANVDDDDFIPEIQRQSVPDAPDSDEEFAERSKTKVATTKPGPVKKAARKVNELAHANFRRLKLRNYGAKGGPGYRSKFRRGR